MSCHVVFLRCEEAKWGAHMIWSIYICWYIHSWSSKFSDCFVHHSTPCYFVFIEIIFLHLHFFCVCCYSFTEFLSYACTKLYWWLRCQKKQNEEAVLSEVSHVDTRFMVFKVLWLFPWIIILSKHTSLYFPAWHTIVSFS